MASGKLDQSLDDILKTSRPNRRGRGGRRNGAGRPASSAAPVGGVQKSTKQPQTKVPTGSGPKQVDSKILISNLPHDVDEQQLKDYFTQALKLSKPKRVVLSYGPNGRSLGVATVFFGKPEHASQAIKTLDNIKIDGRAIKVDLLVSAANAPAPPTLADRTTQPKKDKPKPATAAKANGAASGGSAVRGRAGRRGSARGGRGGRTREKKKTVEELDAEMEDYFPAGDGGDAVATNGGAAAGGDAEMDEVL